MKNLYLISQVEIIEIGIPVEAVVVAETEEDAKKSGLGDERWLESFLPDAMPPGPSLKDARRNS